MKTKKFAHDYRQRQIFMFYSWFSMGIAKFAIANESVKNA